MLQPGRRVLDLGAGTGQATGPLLAAGLQVTAIEPGPNLAMQLQDWHPAATVLVARAQAVRDLGGQVVEHYTSWLIVMRPTRTPEP